VTITATGTTTNLLTNGDFSNGRIAWLAQLTAPATGAITFTTGTAKFAINTAGTINWHVQLYQTVPVTAGQLFTYSFSAKKSSAGTRTINFVVESDATPYTKDLDRQITIDGNGNT
jgi:hypothetical protein